MRLAKWMTAAALMLGSVLPLRADTAGDFDYYVMALSWTPNWCEDEGDARRDTRCVPGAGRGWALHGLWPQYEKGWPSYCRTAERDPTRAESAAMGQIMGSAGLAWHQWQKHGRCSGLSARDYYITSARALGKITLPEVFDKVTKPLKLDALVVEAAFLEANRDLRRDMITVTCKSGAVQEVRVCLTRDLTPRRCGADVIRDCTLKDATLAPIR